MLRTQLRMHVATLSLLLALALPGCKSVPTPSEYSTPQTQTKSQSHSGSRRAGASTVPGVFDFYLFNLSWSPEFCATHVASAECASRPGFVVPGLWPQNNDGTYPEDCDNPTLPTNPAAYLNLMPTVELIEHEWKTHGTCSGLGPDAYFSDVRTALQQIEIPTLFAASRTPPASIAPTALLADFSRTNPNFPAGSFALSCGNNYLTAVEVCFDKDLNPIACRAIRTCHANVIKIAPR